MKEKVHTSVLMVRPTNFGYNPETESTNIFQKKISLPNSEIHRKALYEFDNFVSVLRNNKISVKIFNDFPNSVTPDSIFPNNWFSVHKGGIMFIYPMLSGNRREERRKDIIDYLKKASSIEKCIDLSYYEKSGKFLEGTGSLVFDHNSKVAYANISSRTNIEIAKEVCDNIGYKLIPFVAFDKTGREIYHTNVILSIGNGFAIVCFESVKALKDKNILQKSLINSNLEIIEISLKQMHSFCSNTLNVVNGEGKDFIIMSETARNSFTKNQLSVIKKYSAIISPLLKTIECAGGGSARCMMAEFMDENNN